MATKIEPARRDLKRAGVPEEFHDRALALKALAEARGINWKKLTSKLMPIILGVLEELLKDDES